MRVFRTENDVKLYVAKDHPELWISGHDDALVAVIMKSDHPEWGTDWSWWLHDNIKSLKEVATGRV